MSVATAEQPTPSATTPRTRSRAARGADKAAAPKAAAKRTEAPRQTTPKPEKVVNVVNVVKAPAAPSQRAAKQLLGASCIKALADYAVKCKVPAGLDRDEVLKIIGGWASYIPGQFDDRLPMITAGGRRTV